MVKKPSKESPKPVSDQTHKPSTRLQLFAKTDGQKTYLESLYNDVITICSGPAGSGKTYMAVLYAMKCLISNNSNISKVVITRPIMESGESLGYLPGDYLAKISPYMEPTDEIIKDCLGSETSSTLRKDKTIESCPLAYMRGRTFHKSIMILDEAQNATMEQVKMFLTRMGEDSKVIICGDPEQSDLNSTSNTVMKLISRLSPMDEVGTVELNNRDIVRNNLIGTILNLLRERD